MNFKYVMAIGLMVLTACGPSSSGPEKSKRTVRPMSGIDQTKTFLATYEGTFVEPDHKESFSITVDGNVTRVSVRQVGRTDGTVPYPTVCNYVESGKIEYVEERTAAGRQNYLDYATHVIVVTYSKIELSDDLHPGTTTNPNCAKFLSEEKVRRPVEHQYYGELLNEDSFRIQTSGGGDYVQGGPRTPSTLDEIYSRK